MARAVGRAMRRMEKRIFSIYNQRVMLGLFRGAIVRRYTEKADGFIVDGQAQVGENIVRKACKTHQFIAPHRL